MSVRAGTTRRTSWRTLLTVAAVGALGLGLLLTAERAVASYEEIIDAGKPGLLTLSVNAATPLWATLKPGDTSSWLVRAELDGAATGSLALELTASGKLVDTAGLTAAVSACSGEFTTGAGAGTEQPRCGGTPEPVLATTPLRDLARTQARYALTELHAGTPRELLVTLQLPTTATRADVTDASARVGLGLFAAGDTAPPTTAPPTTTPQPSPRPTATPPGSVESPGGTGHELAFTGADLTALGLVAAGLIGLGLLLHARRIAPHRSTTTRGKQ